MARQLVFGLAAGVGFARGSNIFNYAVNFLLLWVFLG